MTAPAKLTAKKLEKIDLAYDNGVSWAVDALRSHISALDAELAALKAEREKLLVVVDAAEELAHMPTLDSVVASFQRNIKRAIAALREPPS